MSGEDAKQVLANKAFKDAFGRMGDFLEMRVLSCNPDNPAETQRAVLAKQILRGIERELTRMIEDDQIKQIQMAELESPKRVKMIR